MTTDPTIDRYDHLRRLADTAAIALADAIAEIALREDGDDQAWLDKTTAIAFDLAQGMKVDDIADAGTLTPFGSILASREGWNVFGTNRGNEIQRDDEAATFADDEEALAFVRKRAREGSRLHEIALRLTGAWEG